MPKKKREDVEKDDIIRRLLTIHYEEALEDDEQELTDATFAENIETMVESAGDAVHDLVRGLCEVAVAMAPEEEEEEEADDDDDADAAPPRRRRR